MKNTIKLLMCAVMAFCFASCTPEQSSEQSLNNLVFSLITKNNSIIATWESVEGAVFYELQLNKEETIRTDERTYTFEGLKYGSKYTVRINAMSVTGEVLKGGTRNIKIGSPAYREWVNPIPAEAISNNGKWIGGAFDNVGLIINVESGELINVDGFEARDISDKGVAVGSQNGVAAMWVDGEVLTIDLSDFTQNNTMSSLTSITPDGSYAVGWWWNYDDANDYWPSIYGGIIPFCYDVVKNRVSIPTPGERIYNEGAMTLYSVAPDRSLLGLDQTDVHLNVVWENENTPYEYVLFEHDEEYNPVATMGEMMNRFSASGRYIYGMAQPSYANGKATYQAAVFDRTTEELYLYETTGAVSAMTDSGIIFINDAQYYYGTTTFVTTLDKTESADLVYLEEWLLTEHNIDVAKYEPATDTDDENDIILDGTITIGASADGRTILSITPSDAGWVTSIYTLDGDK